MASRPMKNAPPGKEKRATTTTASSSNVSTTKTATTPRERVLNSPKKALSLPRTHDPPAKKPVSSPLAHKPSPLEKSKSVPTNLKSKSSTTVPNESKQQGKKTVSKAGPTTQKNTLLKGKSFGSPSSTSQSQKSPASPGPALRSSSSFSGKANGQQKGLPERNSRAPKEVVAKQQALQARLLNATKKNNGGMIYVKKNETGGSTSSKGKKKIAAPPQKIDGATSVLETQSNEQATEQNGDSVEKGNEGLLSENQEPISETMDDERMGGKTATFEPLSTILEHDQEPDKIDQAEEKVENNTLLDVSSEGVKDSLVDNPEPVDFIKQTEGGNKNMDTEISPETGVEPSEVPENQDMSAGVKTEEPEEELKKDDVVQEMNNPISSDEIVTGNVSYEVEVEAKSLDGGGEEEMGLSKKVEPEKEVEPVVVVEPKKAVVPDSQMAHGKKDVAVSNDAIEETASKLREQRRNKVRALAGAFESVISLQEIDSPKKNNHY